MSQSDDEIQRGWRITGRVQGVGFRWWTRKTGERLGIAGTVKNLPDGSVEIHARGDESTLDRFREALEGGPTSARVEDVRVVESRKELSSDFRIVF